MAELQKKSNNRRIKGLLGSPRDELRLRIHGSRREGQVVVVRIPKCTVGSADSCSLPLRGPGIQPVHCLILRGQRGAVVRCLAPGATLNGMQIQDATLFAGDMLRIGPFELEVLPTVATCNDRQLPPPTKPIPTTAVPTLAAVAHDGVAMDPPSLGDLATTIENRINRIEGQLSKLQQQQNGRGDACETKLQEIKLAQQAVASLSRQLDCERERHGTALESLVAQRDRLASELAAATQTASDLCRELEQVRRAHVETDATSELHAPRIAEVSAEVDRLAERLAETGRHHQQARDQWQANKDALEQRLTDSVNQLTQLEQEFAVVRRGHEDAEAQRHLQDSQSEELRESVRTLKEQLAQQQRQQAEAQAEWLTERQELEGKFEHLEELHRQATIPHQAEPMTESPQEVPAGVMPETAAEITPEPDPAGLLSLADLDSQPRTKPAASQEPLHLEDEIPDGQRHEALVSRLDQLKASRMAAEQQQAAEFRPYEALDNLESHLMIQPSNLIDERDVSPSVDGDVGVGLTDHATHVVDQDGSEDLLGDAVARPAISERNQLFDRLNASQFAPPTAASDSSHEFEAEPESEAGPESVAEPESVAGPGSVAEPESVAGPESVAEEDAATSVVGAPVTASEVLTRMGQLSDVIDHEPIESSTNGNMPIAPLDAELTSDTSTEIGDDDESIEAYMNQLLARVRGGETVQTPAAPRRPVAESSWKPTCEAVEPAESETAGEPSEYLPRSQAPEQSLNLSAMRDLANDSARSAIATHAKKSGFDMALAKMIAAAAGVAGAGLAMFYAGENPFLTFLGVGGGLGAAAFWTWQAIFLKRNSQLETVRKVTPATIGAAHQAASAVEDLGTPRA